MFMSKSLFQNIYIFFSTNWLSISLFLSIFILLPCQYASQDLQQWSALISAVWWCYQLLLIICFLTENISSDTVSTTQKKTRSRYTDAQLTWRYFLVPLALSQYIPQFSCVKPRTLLIVKVLLMFFDIIFHDFFNSNN